MKDLRITDLRFSYADGRTALDGASLEAEKGMRVALVGKNGSGKTTLLMHVLGLLDGTGTIEVCGITLSPSTVHLIREKAGLLFSQVEYQFIMPDLLGDVMLGCPGSREKALAWLERFGLAEYAGRSPLDLSSGEMKRAALAGILARDVEVLLLDEPLGNLDRDGAEHIAGILGGLDRTMVFSTHRKFLVERAATHVAVMERGRITGFMETGRALKNGKVKGLIY
jgi:energy-coupling factor transporter ATP-binding protein EcfA2